MKNFTILLITILISSTLFSQSIPPKREMRAAWIATVTNLDWPSSQMDTVNHSSKTRIN